MITTKAISSVDEVLGILSEQDEIKSLDRYRNSFLYRGLPNSAMKLMTSLRINCKERQKELEPIILRSFTKYAVFEDPALENSVWRQMIIGRHHGLPTRLLDWSHSSLIGLHFAMSERNFNALDTHDSVLWRIDMKELHTILPVKYKSLLTRNKSIIMSVDLLSEAATTLEEYDADMGDRAMVLVEPPSIDPRIINQYSFFALVPSGMDSIETFLDKYTENTVRYIIKKEIRWRVRDMLDQLNINERIVYPGLDGLSQWIARHYYVKG